MLEALHAALADLNAQPLFQQGDFYLLHASDARLIAYGRHWRDRYVLVVVNLDDQPRQGRVPWPPGWPSYAEDPAGIFVEVPPHDVRLLYFRNTVPARPGGQHRLESAA
jgi:hypothetical protein